MAQAARSHACKLALRALPLVALLGCKQPEPRCSIARGDFAATYTLVSSNGPCEPLRGEVLSVEAYTAARANGTPDNDRISIAIQPASLTDLLAGAGAVEANGEDQPYGLGAFVSSRPERDDFCSVPALSEARVRLPELPAVVDACTTTPPVPAVDVSYAFSNVRVYTTAAAYGTQFAANLTYRKDGCVAEYVVAAVFPAVSCGAPVEAPAPAEPMGGAPVGGLDAGLDGSLVRYDASQQSADAGDEDASSDGGCEAPDAGPALVLDESLCAALENPDQGHSTGSGINIDFAVQCDPELLLCVLSGPPPSLR